MSAVVQHLNAEAIKPFAAEASVSSSNQLDNMAWLPCTLTVELPVIRFTIADLLGLKKGAIVETGCHHTSDLPLRVNRLLIAWTEFEVVGDRLAVRVTEQI